jgi:hypothetical protein
MAVSKYILGQPFSLMRKVFILYQRLFKTTLFKNLFT